MFVRSLWAAELRAPPPPPHHDSSPLHNEKEEKAAADDDDEAYDGKPPHAIVKSLAPLSLSLSWCSSSLCLRRCHRRRSSSRLAVRVRVRPSAPLRSPFGVVFAAAAAAAAPSTVLFSCLTHCTHRVSLTPHSHGAASPWHRLTESSQLRSECRQTLDLDDGGEFTLGLLLLLLLLARTSTRLCRREARSPSEGGRKSSLLLYCIHAAAAAASVVSCPRSLSHSLSVLYLHERVSNRVCSRLCSRSGRTGECNVRLGGVLVALLTASRKRI